MATPKSPWCKLSRHTSLQQKDRQRALSAGFNWHLVKPVSIEQLVNLLDRNVVEPTQPAA
ncbi:MAG TPA: hypothetical protein VG937_04560 [Polyangiaceae bacterium]|jgi:hypothetical protein|nr:hypothetical protein [Polyangiaceae bacterium]